MDLYSINPVNQYSNNETLKKQYEVKHENKPLNDFIDTPSSLDERNSAEDKVKLDKILYKVNMGTELTKKEMKYIREKDPELYEKLNRTEKEKEHYEEELSKNKAKEDLQKMRLNKLNAEIQAVKNGEITSTYKLNKLNEGTSDYATSNEYKKLKAEVAKKVERKKEIQQEIRTEQNKLENLQQKDQAGCL